MVQFVAIVVAAAAALAGQAAAQTGPDTCVAGQFYCGFTLIAKDQKYWQPRIDTALTNVHQTITSAHEFDALFFCTNGTDIAWDDSCTDDQPNWRCLPASANACGHNATPNECCGNPSQ